MMIDLKKPMYSEKNVSQRPFVYHKFHTDCPGINRLPPQTEAGVKPRVVWHDLACMQPVDSNGSCVCFITLLTSPSCCVSRFVARGPRFECGLMYFHIVRCEPAVTCATIYMENETHKKRNRYRSCNKLRYFVNKTNRCTEFQFYWYYDSTCFVQTFCPSSRVLSRTSALVQFMLKSSSPFGTTTLCGFLPSQPGLSKFFCP
jgi:hypothetical protein